MKDKIEYDTDEEREVLEHMANATQFDPDDAELKVEVEQWPQRLKS